jgi:hypothetical protein
MQPSWPGSRTARHHRRSSAISIRTISGDNVVLEAKPLAGGSGPFEPFDSVRMGPHHGFHGDAATVDLQPEFAPDEDVRVDLVTAVSVSPSFCLVIRKPSVMRPGCPVARCRVWLSIAAAGS